ncbi:hypothetical protein [Massilia phosphatilytica]
MIQHLVEKPAHELGRVCTVHFRLGRKGRVVQRYRGSRAAIGVFTRNAAQWYLIFAEQRDIECLSAR